MKFIIERLAQEPIKSGFNNPREKIPLNIPSRQHRNRSKPFQGTKEGAVSLHDSPSNVPFRAGSFLIRRFVSYPR
jgi:hypothetical protein